MLNHLEYSVEFPTGKTFAASVGFHTGLTAVTGRNEAGKSLTLEFARFGLWGSKALRGKAADYKTLKVKLSFDLKGEAYRVERTATNAKLFRGDEQVAVGTKPVNLKIISLFGYGMEVFDVANACLQGEIERLGAMKPTERKTLVDKTIGLDAIEEAIDWAAQEHSLARSAADALEEDIVVPEKPTQPDGYRNSGELKEEIQKQQELRDRITRLSAWLDANPELPEPVKPEDPEIEGTVEQLERAAELYDRDILRYTKLDEQIRATVKPVLTKEEIATHTSAIALWEAWTAEERLRASAPAPEHSEEVLYQVENAQKADEIRQRIARLAGKDRHTCPACDHEWSENDDHIIELTREIPLYEDELLPENWSRINPERERALWKAHQDMLTKLSGMSEPAEPQFTKAQLREQALQWEGYDKLEELRIEHRNLSQIIDVNPHPQLDALRRYKSDMSRYEKEFDAWAERGLKRASESTYLDETRMSFVGEETFQSFTATLTEAVAYESRLEHYEEARKAFAEQEQRVAEKRAQQEQWANTRVALRALKAKIKNYLIPSLNSVASVLLSQMTGGFRNEIRIDENFEILVDGQLLNTLSGSGKAAANLAIRLGLGQVLTNRTFSVLMADEIDASMDADRAGFTAECLSNLTKSISQIILVSHKPISAMHHIEVGTTNENSPERAGDDRRGAA